MSYFGFDFGRPPFRPFRRAASAFAALVDCPPLRPRATAAGFLRGTKDIQGFHPALVASVEAVSLEHRGADASKHVGQLLGLVHRQKDGAFSGGADVVCECHGPMIPNRLGYVK